MDMIGYCGIVCSDCPVFLATKKGDDAERKKVAKLLTKKYGRTYRPEDIDCEGCLSNSQRVFAYCALCEIRKCGRGSKIKNCADCIEYPCEKLRELFGKYPEAKNTLNEIRAENGAAKQG